MSKILSFDKEIERMRHLTYAAIMGRATVLGLMEEPEAAERMMDIESADKKFHLRLDDWLNADDFNLYTIFAELGIT